MCMWSQGTDWVSNPIHIEMVCHAPSTIWGGLWAAVNCITAKLPYRTVLSLMKSEPAAPFLLGGLSLHLNHLIASRMANYDWPFGTLPFGLFGSNLDTRDLETYPRTYSGHFWNMSIFDDSRAVWVLFRKWVVSENQSFLDDGAIVTPLIGLDLGGEVPRLNWRVTDALFLGQKQKCHLW